MSVSLVKCALVAAPFVLGTVVVIGNGPYTIEQTTLYTPGQQDTNIWPVGTDRQLIHAPGSFQINIVR